MKRLLQLWALGFLITGCTDPYKPPVSNEQLNLLVVDGYVNASNNTASIRLTRTVNLSSKDSPAPEQGATISIEDNNGVSYALTEGSDGNYTASGFTLDQAKEYRLRLKTSGQSYTSDYVKVESAPPIDSVTWEPDFVNDGVGIFVYAHDPLGKTKYYKWSFEETWEYTSLYNSTYYIKSGVAYVRPPEDQIHQCWATQSSSGILVATSKLLTEDVISHFQLSFLPQGSRRLNSLYSILVQQQSISEDAYSYWTQLQKTTEQLGGLFDPLPNQVVGNIHNDANSSEPVLGYFSISTTTTQRIFISYQELPKSLRTLQEQGACEQDSIPVAQIRSTPDWVLLTGSYGSPFIEGYFSTTYDCVDCRYYGGVTDKPDFWP